MTVSTKLTGCGNRGFCGPMSPASSRSRFLVKTVGTQAGSSIQPGSIKALSWRGPPGRRRTRFELVRQSLEGPQDVST
jgi:hypothetical protein